MRVDHFSTLFGNQSVSVSMADPTQPDCPLVEVNDAFCELTKYSRSEVLGKNCRFLQGADTSPKARGVIADALASGESVCVSIKNYCKDGEPFDNLLFISFAHDHYGRPCVLGCQTTMRAEQWVDDIERNIFAVDNALSKAMPIEARSYAQMFMLQSKSIIAQARSYFIIANSARLARRSNTQSQKVSRLFKQGADQ